MQYALAASLERVDDVDDDHDDETNGGVPAPSPASEPGHGAVVRSMALLVTLLVYTFGPLLVNWSVVVNVPPEAEASILALPARNETTRPYGVTLAHQPGIAKLYVEYVYQGGLVHLAGVLPGDVVSRGQQAGVTVFDESSFEKQESLLEVKGFIENPPGKSYPKANPPLIDPAKPLTLTFDMEHVDVKKGEAYLGVGLVFMRNFLGALVLLLSYLIFFKGSFSKLYTLRNLVILVLPGLFWTIADLFELLANKSTNAALYSVVSQTRLMGTAFFMRIVLGTKQSMAQKSCLVSLTLVIICYMQVPDSVPIEKYWNGFGKPYDPDEQQAEVGDKKGIIFSFAKVALSIVMGVVGQKALQNPELKALPVVGLQALIYSASSLATLPFTFLIMWSIGWDKGIFGGYPVEFRHCLKSWDQELCDAQIPVVVEQGWDYRTFVVVGFYIFRATCGIAILRIFSALTKNLVNASSTVSTYILSLLLLGRSFNFSQFGLTICIMLQITQYAFAPGVEEQPSQGQGG